MGLLDGLLNNVLGQMGGGGLGGGMPGNALPDSGAHAANPVLQMVLQVIQQQGGIGALLQQFTQAGHGGAAQSWLTPGAPNMPINADVLQQVLGPGKLSEIAQKFGMSPQGAADSVAQALPGVVDHMTPDGAVPADHGDQVSQVLAQLQAMRANRP
ncbi:MAG: YidB family protein [Casimicrobiaceae bacterium]